jgi:hypothetical protein
MLIIHPDIGPQESINLGGESFCLVLAQHRAEPHSLAFASRGEKIFSANIYRYQAKLILHEYT